MAMYPKLIPLIGIIVLWSCLSCATLFNTRTQKLTIYPSSSATIICQEDTIMAQDKAVEIRVNRSKNDLLIATISDSVRKNVVIPSRLSLTYFDLITMMLAPQNPKIWHYSNPIFIDVNDPLPKYKKFGNPNRKGETNLCVSLPYINVFNIYPLEERRFSRGGFCGLGVGVEHFYKSHQYLNAQFSFMSNYMLPLPIRIKFLGDIHTIYNYNLQIAHFHQLRRFNIGYGITTNYYRWTSYDYVDSPYTLSPTIIRKKQANIGFMAAAYCQLSQRLFMGIRYQQTPLVVYPKGRFKREEIISIEWVRKFSL